MKVDGGCHCGKVRFEAEIDPAQVSICHCTDCQTLSGAPYRASVAVKAENLTLTGAAPKIYVKTAESGNKRHQAFCGDCGAPIYASAADPNPALFNIRVGAIRQRDQLTPKKQIWQSSAQPWTANITGLEAYAHQSPPKS